MQQKKKTLPTQDPCFGLLRGRKLPRDVNSSKVQRSLLGSPWGQAMHGQVLKKKKIGGLGPKGGEKLYIGSLL